MDKRERTGYVILEAAISYHVYAESKKDAIEVAKYKVSDNKLQIQQVVMVNEQGIRQPFQMERVDKWEWTGVELDQFSGSYNVLGQARIILSVEGSKDRNGSFQSISEYRLPSSAIHDQSCWVVPTLSGPAFVCVRKHAVEWKAAAGEDVYSKVG